jgi:hypothetical protein
VAARRVAPAARAPLGSMVDIRVRAARAGSAGAANFDEAITNRVDARALVDEATDR